MAKPQGSSSFVSLTLKEIAARLGGREDVPVKVSKGWLASVEDIFGGGPKETPVEDDGKNVTLTPPVSRVSVEE